MAPPPMTLGTTPTSTPNGRGVNNFFDLRVDIWPGSPAVCQERSLVFTIFFWHLRPAFSCDNNFASDIYRINART